MLGCVALSVASPLLYSYCASPNEVAMAAATEHSDEIQLSDLINKEVALTAHIELTVWRVELNSYSWRVEFKSKTVQSDTVYTKKLQVVLLSHIGGQYCLGLAKLRRKDEAELEALQARFREGTVWKFSRIKLVEEKSQFIHTPCRIAIDLRNSVAQSVLQSRPFPLAPVPTCTIANVLELKQMQRFDLMAIPVKVLETRRSGAGILIADVRLVDGSARPAVDGAERYNAAMPLTLWFKSDAEFARFEEHVGCKPVVFMCLVGFCDKSGKVQVSTLKDLSWWGEGAGPAYDIMTQKAPDLCGGVASLVDVASLPILEPDEVVDYITPSATLSACGVLGAFGVCPWGCYRTAVLGDATEHLYQLNHVHVQTPTKTDSITTVTGRVSLRGSLASISLNLYDSFSARMLCFSWRSSPKDGKQNTVSRLQTTRSGTHSYPHCVYGSGLVTLILMPPLTPLLLQSPANAIKPRTRMVCPSSSSRRRHTLRQTFPMIRLTLSMDYSHASQRRATVLPRRVSIR